jgi:hypothetical protein
MSMKLLVWSASLYQTCLWRKLTRDIQSKKEMDLWIYSQQLWRFVQFKSRKVFEASSQYQYTGLGGHTFSLVPWWLRHLQVVLVTRVTMRSFDQKILMSFDSYSESHLFLIWIFSLVAPEESLYNFDLITAASAVKHTRGSNLEVKNK